MKTLKMLLIIAMMLFLVSSIAAAGDFDWVKDFNIRAEADPSGFRASLASRFQIGDAQITVVLGDVQHPSDAYMVFRLGELSHHPIERVIQEYKSEKGKGWGVIAQRLGIKPGSAEFHALKRGHDFPFKEDKTKGQDKGKDKGKSKKK